MNFEFTEDQLQIKTSVREFAESELKPNVMEWDEAQHLPLEIFPQLAELGLLGIIFPEEYGGAGLGYVEYATIIEELGRADGSIDLSVAAHNSLCTNHIFQFGLGKDRAAEIMRQINSEAVFKTFRLLLSPDLCSN